MTAASWLSFSPLSHARLPSLSSYLPSSHFSAFSHFYSFISSHHLLMSSSSRLKPPRPVVFAQARRSFSSKFKEDEIASVVDLQFEAPLNIVEYPNPILRAKNKRINTFDVNLKKLVDEMFNVMYRTDGIGLSAPQVGKNVHLMVFNAAGERGEGEEVVLVNPKINRYSKRVIWYNEGCLSFPKTYADVERPDSVRIDAQDITGERFALQLTGPPARVFQHEYDHLQGILFFDRMTDEALDSIRANLQKTSSRMQLKRRQEEDETKKKLQLQSVDQFSKFRAQINDPTVHIKVHHVLNMLSKFQLDPTVNEGDNGNSLWLRREK